MPLLVSSIDHDGCVGHKKDLKPSELISENTPLVDFIQAQMAETDNLTHKVMIGSNRQSWDKDGSNGMMNRNGLAAPLARKLSEHLEAEFDGFTLSDVTEDHQPGHHTNTLLNAIGEDLDIFIDVDKLMALHEIIRESMNDFDFSKDKINIIYAQMHHMATLHPDEDIFFNFFDDRPDILEALHKFFTEYPELVPNNIELNLFIYSGTMQPYSHPYCPMLENGTVVTDDMELSDNIDIYPGYMPINGKGYIDTNYYQTVKLMGAIARDHEGKNPRRGYHMARYMTPGLIEAKSEAIQQENARSLMKQAREGKLPFFKAVVPAVTQQEETLSADDAIAASTTLSFSNQ